MTLYRQLLIVIIVLFILTFIGTLAVNINSTRAFLIEQLESHAQDTATSLGLSLSPHMQEADLPIMTSMVDAIFDRGYYKHIYLDATDGKRLLDRQLKVTIEGVPQWFVRYIPLETPEAESLVMAGWNQAGTVKVKSHPGYAYRELWRTAVKIFFYFMSIAIIVALLGAIILRILLRPLEAVERQAEAICARRYEMQEKVPRTRELARVVQAMNNMTGKVKEMFEEQSKKVAMLRRTVYQDPVTGLGNRRYFNSQFNNYLQSDLEEYHKGALLLVQIKDLQSLNESRGFEAGDELIKQTAKLLTAAVSSFDRHVIARTTGGDFALLIPHGDADKAEQVAAAICTELARLHNKELTDSENVGHVGITLYESGRKAGELLAEADQALRQAQSSRSNSWQRYKATLSAEKQAPGRQEWRAHLASVISGKQIRIFAQAAVRAANAEDELHREVLIRIPGKEGEDVAAGLFMPMAEQFGLARDVDRVVIEKVIDIIRQDETARHKYAINLSIDTVKDSEFISWLSDHLSRATDAAARLIFEFPEFAAVRELEKLRVFINGFRELGVGFALDHFGSGFSTFGYLQSLRPDYVKIDASYIREITRSNDNQFFVSSLCSVVHSLDIEVIALAVEDYEQWDVLSDLSVDGIQGYVIGQPELVME